MSCSADYYLVTCSQRLLVCADVCSAHASRRYQNRKFTVLSQFGLVGAANWQRRLVRAEHRSAHTITTVRHSQRRLVGAANVGSTDQAVLHDVIIHDKLFQHVLVGATSTSMPTSRCFQCLQKNIFAHSGGGTHSFAGEGWGGPSSNEGERHCGTLSTVYVLCGVPCPPMILSRRRDSK